MKTNVFFKFIVVVFTFLSLAIAQGVNEYGMLPCPNGESACPPSSDGSVRGKLEKLSRTVTGNQDVFYQTNMQQIDKRAYSGFRKTPSYTDLVFGDYTVAGNSVLNFEYIGGWSMDHYPSKYEKQGDGNIFKINSSKSTLFLPTSIKPEHIKYARVTWTGSIHHNKAFQDTGGTKNVFGFMCTSDKEITILKEHKKPLKPEWLVNFCNEKTKGENVDCGAIPSMIVNGVYKPEFKNQGYTSKEDNAWHSYEPFTKFDFNKYSDPGNYVEYVEFGQTSQQKKPKPFFTCAKPDVMPIAKKSDLKIIDIINSCKNTLKDSNKYDCDNVLGGDLKYYVPVTYKQTSNDIVMDVANKKTIKLKPEDVESRKIDLVAECKKTFSNDARCDKFKNINYYKPYSENELQIVTDEVLKIDIKVKSSDEIDSTTKTFWEVRKETYTLDLVREDCKKTKSNQNKPYEPSACDDITKEHAKNLIGKPRLAGGNSPYYKTMSPLFGGFECSGYNRGKCEFACENNAKGSDNLKCPTTKKVYRFAGMEYSKNTAKGDYCSVYPEKCVEVESADISFRGSVGIDDFCKANPNECSKNVPVCKKLEFSTDSSSYCKNNPDKCTTAKMCTGYTWIVGEKKDPSRAVENENKIAEMTRRHLKSYDEMTIQFGKSYQNVKALDDDIYYTFSANTTSGDKAGGVWFIYSANADVTEFVKNALSKYDKGNNTSSIIGIPIVGGDVKTSDGYVVNFWDYGWRPYKSVFWDLGGVFGTGVVRTSFGSWILTVVYSDEDSYRATSTKKEDRIKSPFKPKNVTIYNGFAGLVDDTSKPSPNGVRLNFDLTNFYTPLENNYDAKATVYASANANYGNEGDSFKISNKGDNNDLVGIINKITNNESFSGGISIVKPNQTEVSVIDYEKRRAISINSYILNTRDKQLYMKGEQDSIHLQYGVQAVVGTSEQTFPSMFAFSTDLYVPDVCYYNTIYNAAGKSSRGKGFVVREGETVKNQVYFAIAKDSENEEAHGLKVKAKLSDNIQYVNNTMRIDNSLSEKGANDFIDSKLKYMKDNEKGLYNDDKFTNSIPEFKDKQFNKYDGKYLSFFIGKGAGDINGNTISGGSLYKNKQDKVYVEYKTKVGGYYEEPTFNYDVSIKGHELDYNFPMYKCPTPNGKEWENIVEVVPLDGVKVVNEDFKKKGDYDGLYTQIANKPFNLKLNYDVNITGKTGDDLDRLLSNKEICKLLGYGNKCESESFIKEKVDEFNKKRKELQDEIDRLNKEILDAQKDITKKENEIIIAKNELAKAEAKLLEAEQKVKEAQEAYDEAEPGLAKNNAKTVLDAAESDRNKAKEARETANTKVTNLEGELTKLKSDLEKAQTNKGKNESDLGKTESPIGDEMTRRVGKLDGKFETTLTTADDLGNDRSNCKKVRDDSSLHFNHYQDFYIKEKTHADEVSGIETIMYINDEKASCANKKAGCFNPAKTNKAFSSYEYFTNTDESDKIIDMKNVVIGYARPDYTFIVSYFPSGAEMLTSCHQECISRYHDEPGTSKDTKIEACKKECSKKYQPGKIDEKYLNEYRVDVCAGDTFAVRPAYFAYNESEIKDIYTAGDSKALNESFEKKVYPADENGNYVLGYDSILQPNDGNVTAEDKSTIFATVVPDSCNLDEVKNIVRDNDYKTIKYEDSNLTGSILWSNNKNASNNLKVDFSIHKDNKDKNVTERLEYNKLSKENTLDSFKTSADGKKQYADVSLGSIGKLNYYNIGYAKLRLTDSQWTKFEKPYVDTKAKSYNYELNNENQRYGEYIGFKERDKDKLSGIIGGYAAIKNGIIDQDIILKFKHGKVIVSVLGIKDAIKKQDPFKPADFYTYTFFNSEPKEMGASLDMNVTASLTDADICVQKECNAKENTGAYKKIEIYPTLYHGGCYARDVQFGLDFAFDCNQTASDKRCESILKSGSKDDCKDKIFNSNCYKPIEGQSTYGKLKDGLVYYNKKDDNKTTISNDVKAQEEDEDGNKKTVDKPGEIEILVQEDGFNNASYLIPLNFNFIRFPGSNNALDPKLVYADDFIRSKNVPFEEKDLPTDKEIKNGDVLTNGIKAHIVSFKKFNNEILELIGDKIVRRDGNSQKDHNGEFLSLNDKYLPIDISSKATFYYGYINAEEREYKLDLNEDAKEVKVYSMFYYSGEKDEGNKKDKLTDFARDNLPILYLEDNVSIKQQVNETEKKGFYSNKFEYYDTLDDIKSDKFVSGYTNPKVKGINVRSAMEDTKSMYERLSLGVAADSDETVRVNVKPWFVFSDTDHRYSDKYNTFVIKKESENIDTMGKDGNWGGTGKVKDGDIVGRYLDNQGDASKGRLKNRDRLENAINW
ncbi:hypothetical protein [Campylobacter ureolyticus]|uniref:hypothetical protein n=1 Tax=Campylobacter ureolyticus TaxID=827 RepID=UPI00290FCAC0|nr:hypothetical protein [Campylobacter ureolyticus]MDU7070188.1 hypothetical protein [Campylobacter ureolyticus]